jgi:thiamine biosynthesis lipoprotein
MTTQRAMADPGELTGVPLYQVRTEVAGVSVRICLVGGDAGMVEDAWGRLRELLRCWDGAAVDSEITRINRGSGTAVFASPETVLLVGLALQAARETDGGYDPRARDPAAATEGDNGTEWTKEFLVDTRSGTVGIPSASTLDPGGVEHGLAADLVVADVLEAGAYGVCVDVAGNVCTAGVAPSRAGWLLRIDTPGTGEQVASLRLRGGAMATGARTADVMRTPATVTRTPATVTRTPATDSHELVAVTVVAASAWHAQAIARAALRAGYRRGRALVDRASGAALFHYADATYRPTIAWQDFVA